MAIGWGGYIQPGQELAIFGELQAKGCTIFRPWLNANSAGYIKGFWDTAFDTEADFAMMDKFASLCGQFGMRLVLDICHNYPPTDYITGARVEEWILKSIKIGQHFAGNDNVIIEPCNENMKTDLAVLYRQWLQRFRAAGCENPVLFNFMYQRDVVSFSDSNYYVGVHYYARGLDGLSPVHSYPISLESFLSQHPEVAANVDPQFVGIESLPYGCKGWICGEMGPTYTTSLLENPSAGSMAGAMRYIATARKYGASICCYMINDYSTVDASLRKMRAYERLALQYFNEPYMAPLTGAADLIGGNGNGGGGTVNVVCNFTVVDSVSKQPIQGVRLTLTAGSGWMDNLTDGNGKVSVILMDGVYTVQGVKTGYQVMSANVSVPAVAPVVNFTLEILPVGVEPPPPPPPLEENTVVERLLAYFQKPSIDVMGQKLPPAAALVIGLVAAEGLRKILQGEAEKKE